MTARLIARELTVRFGGLMAVDEIGLDIVSGEILGLIGPNGAGKSTVINALTGFVTADAKELSLTVGDMSSDLCSMSPRGRSRAGIIRTFQTPRLIPELTVAQNIAMGTISADLGKRWFEAVGGPMLARGTRKRHDGAVKALGAFGLEHLADHDPRNLSLGEQRIVEIARATMSGATVLLLDEPFAGLSSVEQERLSAELDSLRTQGIALLLVEHNLEHVRSLADTVLAMDEGAEFMRGAAADVLDSSAVRERYLGEEIT